MDFGFHFEKIGTKLHWLFISCRIQIFQITDFVQLNRDGAFSDRVAEMELFTEGNRGFKIYISNQNCNNTKKDA